MSKSTRFLPKKLERGLKHYTKLTSVQPISSPAKTCTLAAATAITAGSITDAAVITTFADIDFNFADGTFLLIDIDGDNVDDFQLTNYSGLIYFRAGNGSATAIASGNSIVGLNSTPGTFPGTYYAKRIDLGDSINASADFDTQAKFLADSNGTLAGNQFNNNNEGYVGVLFDISGDSHLGYIDIEGTADGIHISGWAYNDLDTGEAGGESITTAPIPEMNQIGGIALLALGAVGIREFKRRRKQQ